MALLFYVIVPNGLALRPHFVPGNDIFAQLVRMIYRSDTPMNVCPSIHVFNSVTLMLAYYRSAVLTPAPPLDAPAAMVLCMSITLSTMLLKQHSVIDVVFGLLLALALDYGATVLQSEDVGHRRLPEVIKQKPPLLKGGAERKRGGGIPAAARQACTPRKVAAIPQSAHADSPFNKGAFLFTAHHQYSHKDHRQRNDFLGVHLLMEDRHTEDRDVDIPGRFQHRADVQRHTLVGQHRQQRAAHKQAVTQNHTPVGVLSQDGLVLPQGGLFQKHL